MAQPNRRAAAQAESELLKKGLDAERQRCTELAREAEEARRSLEERVQFEQILGDTCSTLVNVDPEELDGRIDSSLRTLVEFLDVDRSSLMEVSAEDGKMRGTHSWTRPGLQEAELFEPLDAFAFYIDRLRHGHMVVMSSVNDLPPEASHEREYCVRTGLKSHVGVPLMIGGDFVGALGFAYLRQEMPWPVDMLGRLKLIGEAFANALLRKRWNLSRQEVMRMLERRVEQRTALVEEKVVQLRRLALQLSEVAQRERRRIVHVLHDGLQQVLVGVKFTFASFGKWGIPSQSRDVINAMLDEAITISRSLTVELCPPSLYELGLIPALRQLAVHMKDTYGLQVDMKLEHRDEPPSRDVRIFLFEAARELLFNVVRHALTSEADLVLEKTDQGEMRLTVRDRGAGFEPTGTDRLAANAFGLFGLRQRLDLFGGRIDVTSSPGNGTCVLLSVPGGAAIEEG
jgi:signal transduction histidine kinase